MPGTETSAAGAAQAAQTIPSPFRGFRRPNYTPVPDELFDELLVELAGGELKVLLYIIRRTFGFRRDSDAISLSQMLGGIQTRDGRTLDHGIGLSKKTLLLALRTLEERGVILTERRQSVEKGNEPTVYRLNVRPADDAWPDEPEPTPDAAPSPPTTPSPETPTPGDASHREATGEKTTPPLGEKLHQGGGVISTPPLGEKFPQALGGKTTPSPRGKNSPTQYTEIQETVEQQPAARQTVNQQTPPVSTSFELLANMQQTREPSRFSKEPHFGAISQRTEIPHAEAAPPSAAAARDSHAIADTAPDAAVGGRGGRAASGAVGEDLGGHGPSQAAAPAPTDLAYAPERPKTGRRRHRTAEPEAEPTPAADAPAQDVPGSPRFAQRQAQQSAPLAARPTSRPSRQRPLTPAATAPDGDARRPRRAPPPPLSPYLEGLVTRYSEELHDEDHIPQNLGQAGRLWQASGWSESDFIHALHEAKSITVKRDIKKRATFGGEFGARNKMPYYFKVLRDMLGLKPPDASAHP